MKQLLFLFAVIITGVLHAQQPGDERAQMEKERQQIQREINDLKAAYSKLNGQTKASLNQANVIKRKIELQERYLNNINKEIRFINDDIYLSSLEINKMQKELDTLKAQYARSVVYAYKNRSNYDFLNFIFSASSFNDAIKRVTYLKSYRAFREQQVNSIKEKQQQIADRKNMQMGKVKQKQLALQNQTKQVNELEDEKKKKDEVVKQLKSQEGDLKKQISTRQKRSQQLLSQINVIVERELAAARKKAKEEADRKAKIEADRIAKLKADAKNNSSGNNTTTSNTNNTNTGNKPVTTTTTPKETKAVAYNNYNEKDEVLAANFEANRGKLPWPVDNGFVSAHFGKNKDEDMGLTFDNPGITISTPSAGTPVKSIFEGEVSSVFNMGDGMAVMIQHGKYFSIYSNLNGVTVAKGATVTKGQVIGRAGADDDGNGGQIDLLLMKEKAKVNPEPWLRR